MGEWQPGQELALGIAPQNLGGFDPLVCAPRSRAHTFHNTDPKSCSRLAFLLFAAKFRYSVDSTYLPVVTASADRSHVLGRSLYQRPLLFRDISGVRIKLNAVTYPYFVIGPWRLTTDWALNRASHGFRSVGKSDLSWRLLVIKGRKEVHIRQSVLPTWPSENTVFP